MSPFDEAIKEMKKDYIHGSTWYFERISSLLANICDDNIEILRKVLPDIRPGMATISNLSEILSKKSNSSITDIREIGLRLLKYSNNSSILLNKELANLELKSSITISFSSAVASLIDHTGMKQLLVLRSSPGTEWVAALKKYSSSCEVTVVPDSTMFYFLKKVDSVVIGFDGMFSDGYILNKIGSYPLCLCAHRLKKKVIAVGESFKASLDKQKRIAEKISKIGKKRIKLPIFEEVPLHMIDLLITDQGAFKTPESRTIKSLHDKFLKKVLEI